MGSGKSSSASTITTLSIVMVVLVCAAIVVSMVQRDSQTVGVPIEPVTAIDTDDLGVPLSAFEEKPVPTPVETAETKPVDAVEPERPEEKRLVEITERFEQAIVMLHAREYEHAATALYRVLDLSPRMPEAYVNMGYAQVGLEKYREALVFFEAATRLKAEQANAYWGMAVAHEQLGDLPAALGAMRTFLHLSPGTDDFARRARSALWEWEEALARGPLPEEEREFLRKGTLQWESRNTPRDEPVSGEQELEVKPLQ